MLVTFYFATSVFKGNHSDWFPEFQGFSCLLEKIEFRQR